MRYIYIRLDVVLPSRLIIRRAPVIMTPATQHPTEPNRTNCEKYSVNTLIPMKHQQNFQQNIRQAGNIPLDMQHLLRFIGSHPFKLDGLFFSLTNFSVIELIDRSPSFCAVFRVHCNSLAMLCLCIMAL